MKRITKLGKRFLSIFMVIALLVCTLSVLKPSDLMGLAAFATETETYQKAGENITWSFEESTGILTISGTGEMFDWEYQGSPWCCYNKIIKSVIIDNGVTSIGNYAFLDCEQLKDVDMPDSITRIGDAAFLRCTSLKEINLSENSQTIGEIAFCECQELTNLIIPDAVLSIGGGAFYACTSLTSITIPENVTSIGGIAFYYCSALTSVTIPCSVVSIGESAFEDCSNLRSVYYTGDIAGWCNIEFADRYSSPMYYSPDLYIGDDLFAGDVIIPEGVTRIGNGAFQNWCYKVRSITIPKSVKNIGVAAFGIRSGWDGKSGRLDVNFTGTEEEWNAINIEADNEPLLNRTINYNETGFHTGKCGDNLIWNLNKLTGELVISGTGDMYDYGLDDSFPEWTNWSDYIETVRIEDGVTSIGDEAFAFDSNLKSVIISNSVTRIGDAAFRSCGIVDMVIPDGVTEIGISVFAQCEELQNITISESVKSIGSGAFYSCYNLETIVVNENNTEYSSDEYGVLFNKDKTELIKYPGGSESASYIVPNGVTNIGYGAFNESSRLANVTIPDSVTKIESTAFDDSYRLTDVYYTGTEDEWKHVTVDEYNHYFLDATVHCKKILSDKNEEIWIEGFDDSFDEPVIIQVSKQKAGKPHLIFGEDNNGKTYSPIAKYDITIKNSKEEIVQPSRGTITVKIKIPENINVTEQDIVEKNLLILHYPKDGSSRTEISGTGMLKIENGYIVFEVDHFSYFLVCIETDVPTIQIRNNSKAATVNYGDILKLTADTTDMTEDMQVVWYVNGEKKGVGETFRTTIKSDAEISAKITDSEGNVVADENGNEISDSQKVTVKDSLWLRIVSFFKNLFRMNRVVVQFLCK